MVQNDDQLAVLFLHTSRIFIVTHSYSFGDYGGNLTVFFSSFLLY